MHILSAANHSEFLSCPALVRFDLAQGSDGLEPTLLIKADTLTLKYFVRLGSFGIVVFRLPDARIGYAVQIRDDGDKWSSIWSIAQRENELEAIRRVFRQRSCPTFLFNELAISVSWAQVEFEFSRDLERLCDGAALALESDGYVRDISEVLGAWLGLDGPAVVSRALVSATWTHGRSSYITNRLITSTLEIDDADEGAQQEKLAEWLLDALQPDGVVRGAQVCEGRTVRELSDLFLTHSYGTILFESKTLAVMERGKIPTRSRLKENVRKKLDKALRQLQGGISSLRRGGAVTDAKGGAVEAERAQPVHAVILVPDLSLLSDGSIDLSDIEPFMRKTGSFLHVLDPSELLRMVQAAQQIARAGSSATVMMAFDFYLMERAKKSLEIKNLIFGMSLRIR